MSADTAADLKDRLAAAKTRRAEIEAEHAPRRELAALEAAVAREEQAAKDDEAIAAAEVKLRGEFEAVRTDQGVIILHKPDSVIYKRFQDLPIDKISVDELHRVVKSALEYPSGPDFERLITSLPGALAELAQACGRLMGASAERVRGKV